MNIIVCIKRVPDTGAMIEIEKDGLEIKADLPWILNPYDEFAIEEAIRIKERLGGSVFLLNASSEGGEEVLRRGLSMGADSAIYVKDPLLKGSEGLGIARVLARAIRDIPFDLILCGKQGVDGDSGIVGGALAGLLSIPLISAVKGLKVVPENRSIEAFREIEGGMEQVESTLPALLTAHKGLNEPRYPSLSGIMKAKREKIRYLDLTSIGIEGGDFLRAHFKRAGLSHPPLKRKRIILKGDVAEQVKEAVKFLRDEVKIL